MSLHPMIAAPFNIFRRHGMFASLTCNEKQTVVHTVTNKVAFKAIKERLEFVRMLFRQETMYRSHGLTDSSIWT